MSYKASNHDIAAGGAPVTPTLQMGSRRFGRVNWMGLYTLCTREIQRFMSVWTQTVLAPLVTAGLSTLAVRVPAHPLAQELLRAFDGPLAAPSANRSGRISPTLPDHVLAGLDGEIEAVLMGGASEVGVESTILWLAPAPVLLRPGGLPAEALEAMLGAPLETGGSAEAPSAPGQLLSHYAPEAGLRMDATEARAGEVLLGFGPVSGAMSLSESGDLHEAAARLFGALHALDGQASVIAVAPIPEVGLGRAINDRLRRAAAPRAAAGWAGSCWPWSSRSPSGWPAT